MLHLFLATKVRREYLLILSLINIYRETVYVENFMSEIIAILIARKLTADTGLMPFYQRVFFFRWNAFSFRKIKYESQEKRL